LDFEPHLSGVYRKAAFSTRLNSGKCRFFMVGNALGNAFGSAFRLKQKRNVLIGSALGSAK